MPTAPTTLRADPAAAGKAVAPPKAEAAVVPMKPPEATDISFPGGTVSPVCDGRMTMTLDPRSGARTLGGSDYQEFAQTLLDGVLATLPTRNPADMAKRVAAAAAALAAFGAADEVEAMLAGQAVAMHHMALECFRRAMLPDQNSDIASKLRKDGANLCRGMSEMLDSLDRRRGKGPQVQVMRIERVVVDGNAVIGNVLPAAPKVGGGVG